MISLASTSPSPIFRRRCQSPVPSGIHTFSHHVADEVGLPRFQAAVKILMPSRSICSLKNGPRILWSSDEIKIRNKIMWEATAQILTSHFEKMCLETVNSKYLFRIILSISVTIPIMIKGCECFIIVGFRRSPYFIAVPSFQRFI